MAIDRKAIIEATIAAIKAKMPNEVIAKYKDYGSGAEVQTLSTGSLAADSVLGGGFARGRLACIVGHTSAGKTTLALTACAELQRENPDANILYIDAECSIDPKYARSLGVIMDEIFLIQPDNGEDAYEAADMFIRSGVADLVVIDSMAACIPKAMFEVELGDQAQIGMGARLDSQGISRIFASAHKNGTTVILINQWKKGVKINQFDRTDGISGNYYMPGGETFKFYLSQLIEVQRVGKVFAGDVLSSYQTRVRVLKNKIAPPGRESDFFITFGIGIDQSQECIELGIQSGDVIRNGKMYHVKGDDDNCFNGRPKFIKYLYANPEIVQKLRKTIKEEWLADFTEDIVIDTGEEVVKDKEILE